MGPNSAIILVVVALLILGLYMAFDGQKTLEQRINAV